MSVPTPKVEIGFDLTDSNIGPYFRLDDPIYGQLDYSPYGLGGTVFFDVTSKVRSISIQRGKNRQLDQYDQGLANIVFNNNDRTFDPEYPNSPYYGQIIPKRQIRISSYPVAPVNTTRTNLMTNPSFESGSTQWAAARLTTSITTDTVLFGSQALRGVVNGTTAPQYFDHSTRVTIKPGLAYTGSAYVYLPTTNTGSTTVRAEFHPHTGTGYLAGITGTNTIITKGQWTRVSVTGTMPATALTVMLRIVFPNSPYGALNDVMIIDGAMIEQSSTLGSYFDGNTTDSAYTTYSWNGTTNLSSSQEFVDNVNAGRTFVGIIDDWNLTYEPNGDSIVAAACSDAIGQLAVQTIELRTNEAQYSGDRVNTILSLPEVNWSLEQRDVETGQMLLGADTIPDDTSALAYLRTIEKSEPGSFFVSKTGNVVFRDRLTAATSGGLVLADDGTGIPYTGMRVQYGSELLANEIVLQNYANTEVIAQDTDSIGLYGVSNLTQTGLLVANQSDLGEMAVFFASKFAQPEYRFESVEVIVDQLPTIQQAQILALELGSVVKIVFTPNGITPAIEKYAEIIRIDHAITITNHVVSLGFATLDFTLFVLDDAEFGKLDSNNALAF